MKIAFIVGQFPVLSETFILNQITGLLERGHEVDIYADQPGDAKKVHPDVEKYALLERTYYLPQVPENLLLRAIQGLGLVLTGLLKDPLGVLRSLNVFRYGKQALSLWLLYSFIPNFDRQYDIIHCQFGTLAFRGMAFQQMNAPQAKLITIFRGFDISQFVQQKGRQVYETLFRTGDFFLVNCEFFARRVIELGCDPKRIRVHLSGLDCSKFQFQPRYAPADGPIHIVTTGRLVEKKGIEYSIRAVAQLAATHPQITYTILGDGPLMAPFQQLIEALNIGHIVHLAGWKTEAEIIEQLNQAHIFVAPSVTASAGDQDAPINVLKEAMALGLPVVSTDHGGIPELVEDGISGFLVPESDANAIAHKLVYLIEHPEIWPQMGQAGRAYVAAHYDLAVLNDQLLALYQSLTQPPSNAPPAQAPDLLPTYTL
ncbi:MAG: glycosyltransferase [Cyanobacteria bacterium Co-bin13]|nr:glycosyltransferase [Cyanobacteria bacterium Co-bin13]